MTKTMCVKNSYRNSNKISKTAARKKKYWEKEKRILEEINSKTLIMQWPPGVK